MKRVLDPILPRPEFSAAVERELNAYLQETLFQPLRDVLPSIRENANDPIYAALLAGAIQYSEGLFFGQLEAGVSKALRDLGARSRLGGLYLPPSETPVVLRSAMI